MRGQSYRRLGLRAAAAVSDAEELPLYSNGLIRQKSLLTTYTYDALSLVGANDETTRKKILVRGDVRSSSCCWAVRRARAWCGWRLVQPSAGRARGSTCVARAKK